MRRHSWICRGTALDLSRGKPRDEVIYIVRAEVERYADRVLDAAWLAPGMTLADVDAGEGLVAFRAIDRIGPSSAYPDTPEKIAKSPIANYYERNLCDFVRSCGFTAIRLQLHIEMLPSTLRSWDVFLNFSPHLLGAAAQRGPGGTIHAETATNFRANNAPYRRIAPCRDDHSHRLPLRADRLCTPPA